MPLAFVRIPYDMAEEHLAFINEYGLNLEIYFSAKTLDTITTRDVEGLVKNLHPEAKFTVHAPFMDLCPGAVDPQARDLVLKRFAQTFELAKPLGPEVVVFHSGYEKWKYEHKPEAWLEGSLIVWEQVLGMAEGAGSRIAIENIFEDEPGNLTMLMQRLGSERLGICFDTGHFNLFSKVPLAAWLQGIGEHIIEFHLHDNIGDTDTHLAIGEGTFDFEQLFSGTNPAKRRRAYTIEAMSTEETLKSLRRLEKLLQRFPA